MGARRFHQSSPWREDTAQPLWILSCDTLKDSRRHDIEWPSSMPEWGHSSLIMLAGRCTFTQARVLERKRSMKGYIRCAWLNIALGGTHPVAVRTRRTQASGCKYHYPLYTAACCRRGTPKLLRTANDLRNKSTVGMTRTRSEGASSIAVSRRRSSKTKWQFELIART